MTRRQRRPISINKDLLQRQTDKLSLTEGSVNWLQGLLFPSSTQALVSEDNLAVILAENRPYINVLSIFEYMDATTSRRVSHLGRCCTLCAHLTTASLPAYLSFNQG